MLSPCPPSHFLRRIAHALGGLCGLFLVATATAQVLPSDTSDLYPHDYTDSELGQETDDFFQLPDFTVSRSGTPRIPQGDQALADAFTALMQDKGYQDDQTIYAIYQAYDLDGSQSLSITEKRAILTTEYAALRDLTGDKGSFQIRYILEKLFSIIKWAMIPVVLIFVAVAGLELFFNTSDEELYGKKIRQLLGIGEGFFIFAVAVILVDTIAFGQRGEILRPYLGGAASTDWFGQNLTIQTLAAFNLLSTLVIIVAVLMLIIAAIQLMLRGEDEASRGKLVSRITASVVGIVTVSLTQSLAWALSSRGFNAQDNTGTGQLIRSFGDAETFRLLQILSGWTNFILGFMGVLAVISLIYGGFRLIAFFGDETATTEAKNIVISAVIALMLVLSAYTIVNYFALAV